MGPASSDEDDLRPPRHGLRTLAVTGGGAARWSRGHDEPCAGRLRQRRWCPDEGLAAGRKPGTCGPPVSGQWPLTLPHPRKTIELRPVAVTAPSARMKEERCRGWPAGDGPAEVGRPPDRRKTSRLPAVPPPSRNRW